MKLGPNDPNAIVCGDAIEVMAQLPDACVDAIVTDPPYGLEFMGKEWDRFKGNNVIMPPQGAYERKKGFDRMVRHLSSREGLQAYQSWTTTWATEAYRILKPGAYMLVMGGARTHHRLGCGLEDAGFEIRDELAWIYASGFPKNYDVSKGIDKKARGHPQGGSDPLSPHHGQYKTQATEGKRSKADKGQQYGQGSQWTQSGEWKEDVPKPATPEAQYWEGYGTALKPAHESIWLCKKSNEGTYVDNVLKHGCGAMNIDECRIAHSGEKLGGGSETRDTMKGKEGWDRPWRHDPGMVEAKCKRVQESVVKGEKLGRWPANVLVDCYPEEFQGGVVIEGEGKGQLGPFKEGAYREDNLVYGRGKPGIKATQDYQGQTELGDGLLGPYTRFFVIPKPSKREKNKGCMELYYRREKGQHIRIDREEWEELIAEEKRIKEETGKHRALQARGNIHVTVKPVRLGKWLIKLITPHQHPVVVVDPFCGSGTFLVSARELNEGEGYQISYLGIDKDEHSVETAEARFQPGGTKEQPLLL